MRALPLLVSPLALSLLAITAPPADALCKVSAATVFPLADVVPPRPVLFRFEPKDVVAPPIVVRGPAGPVKVFVAETGTVAGMRVTAIQVEADQGWFTVETGEGKPPRRFEIRDEPPPPAIETEEDKLVWAEDHQTSCSYTRGLHMALRAPGVVAFRAHWSDGHDELVPPQTSAFFWDEKFGGEIDPAAAHVYLGHPYCFTDLVDPAYAARRDVELYAMYADGMEQQIGQQVIASGCALGTEGGKPFHEYGPYPRQPSRYPARWDRQIPAPAPAPAIVAAPAVVVAPPPASCASRLPWWIAGGAAAVAAGAVTAAVLVVLRRRRRVDAVVP